MTPSDEDAIHALHKLAREVQQWQYELTTKARQCCPQSSASVMAVEDELSDLRTAIGVAIVEIGAGM